MKKLIEIFLIEVQSDGEPLTAWESKERYPSKEEIEEVIRLHGAGYANVVKIYTLEEEGVKMKGRYEQRIRSQIKRGMGIIGIDWLGMSPQEAGDGGADRCTEILVSAGYRPDKPTVAAVNTELRDAYANGQKVNGKYVRLPQETWIRSGI